LGAGALASCQQLPGSTRKSWTGLSTRWELGSEMHGSESGSGSQAGQQGPLQMLAMDEARETLVIPQL